MKLIDFQEFQKKKAMREVENPDKPATGDINTIQGKI